MGVAARLSFSCRSLPPMIDLPFVHPGFLLLLLAVPLVLALTVGDDRARRRWRALGYLNPVRGSLPWVLGLAASFWIIALAGPRFGLRAEQAVGREVVLVFDVSLSMAARDAWPSRLGSAVDAAQGLILWLGDTPNDRVGIVAFAGRGVVVCPLTRNLGAAREALQRLKPGSIEPGGSNLGAGLDAALRLFESVEGSANRSVLLFSDGEDHQPAWAGSLEGFERGGISIQTIALGDSEGAALPSAPTGKPIVTRRKDDSLREIAARTGGAFLPVGTARLDLAALYRERIALMTERGDGRVDGTKSSEMEPTFWIIAGLLALVSGSVPALRPGSRRRIALLLCGVVLLGGARARDHDPALTAYEAGDFERALELYQAATVADPASAKARFNAGACLYRLGRYAEAAASYQEARTRALPDLQPIIDFSLGNSAAALGEFHAALGHYDSALGGLESGTANESLRADIQANRAAVAARLAATQRTTRTGDREGPRQAGPSTKHPDSTDAEFRQGQPPANSQTTPAERPGDAPVATPADRLQSALRAIENSRAGRPNFANPSTADPSRLNW